MNPTPEQIAEAEAILKARDANKFWPKGTVLISETAMIFIVNEFDRSPREYYREASEAEIEMLKSIPEFTRKLEAMK